MTMIEDIDLRLGRWQDALSDVEHVDAVIVDAPYSARTHGGHDDATRADGSGVRAGKREHTKPIAFPPWSAEDVAECVDTLAPRCRGWFLSMTDHALAPSWCSSLDRAGFYVFAPLPLVEIGSRVRLLGDGPASWVTWIIAARPRSGAFRDGTACNRWGALRGAYIFTGRGDRVIVGGKRTEAMRALVRDYTRPGDLVCDPCSGGGTTARACQLEGRRFVGAEVDPETYRSARARLAQPFTAPLFQSESAAKTGDLFDDEPST
jgi:hypothetical protein